MRAAALLALALLSGPARAAPAPVAGLPLPGCAEVRAAALFDAALVASFEKRYPPALVGEASVERLALDPGQVENAAAYLACVAGLTGFDVYVAEQGLALFASRRHGRAALAALDRIARGPGPEARGARDYARQIRAYLRGPSR
ncbi:hypothetical protein [Methylobacterium frigidaeris]|uniref:Uncharacterized protein n=1 Tax=Methylobacterium frigidaeris TaxID=2038277 RepID=A0AA37HDI9_9HYPH|nr:hypothetical protein [Methylobacterium frigidaeris]PIK72862.1 hypothetical protein CS379_11650 [Methylobacterium frigidaeris]GJD64006.1 hypothetical protein MPEAHAMD_4180 [Methylobacterium frigidaeris]